MSTANLCGSLLALAELKILVRNGKGRASKYVLLEAKARSLESSDNLPMHCRNLPIWWSLQLAA